jgi:phage terminase small subunit
MKRFCLEYLIDLNGTQAAIRAGYSERSAYSIGQENLKKPEIQLEIARLQREREERTEINADKVLRELAYQGFARITGVCDFSKKGLVIKDSETLPDWEIATIQEVGQIEAGKAVKTYVKQHSKSAALKLLMQHLGLASDFNQAIATLRKYGLIVRKRKSDGIWEVVEVNDEASTDS